MRRILKKPGKAASKFRNKLGESLSAVLKFDAPLAQATALSLEALKACSSGFKVTKTTGPAASISFYKQAIDMDPNFALAHAKLSRTFEILGNLD